jgi:hypothetical protein
MRPYPVVLASFAFATTLSASQAPSRPLAEVPFTLYQNGVIVRAVVNARDTVRLLLDTGWGPLAMVSSSATRLGTITSLAIGDAVQTQPFIETFPAEGLRPLIGPHDGILSSAFFRDLVLQIDYPRRVVRFFRTSPISSPPTAGRTRASVPMVFSPRAPGLPFTDSVWVDGRRVRGLFDTGGSGAFVAMRRLIDQAGLIALPDSGHVGIGMFSGGTMVQQRAHFAQVGRISVGGFAVDTPRVLLAPPQLAGDDWGHDVVIGYGFFKDYVVTFDYPGRRVVLER